MIRTRNELTDIICKTILFRKIDREEVEKILPILDGKEKVVEPDGIYLMAQDVQTKMGIVMKGSLNVSKILSSGTENLYEKLWPGYTVSLSVVCSSTQVSPYTVYSIEGARIFEFPYENIFSDLIPEKFRLVMLRNISNQLSNENIKRQNKVDVLSVNGLRDRVMMYLETQASKKGTSSFTIPFNREELANYLCVNRSALSHELSLMRQEGIIEFRKNRFHLLGLERD